VPLRAAVLLVALLAPAAEASAQGRVETGAMRVAGLERTWRAFVPDAVRPGAPLVLVLHGGGDTGAGMAAGTRFDDAAARHGFVAVYPDAIGTRFNAGICCSSVRGDVAFVDRLLDRFARTGTRTRAERGRPVVAAGFSNGGFLAYRLACQRARRFTGVAAVAATELTVPCRPARPVSVLHLQARDETKVPFAGGRWAGDPRAGRAHRGSPGAFALAARWRARNGCPRGRTATTRTPALATWHTTGCRGATQVRLVVPATGGHRWFGGRPPYGAPDDAVDATEEVARFATALR